MVQQVARSPSRLCSTDGKICCLLWRRLEYDFLACLLAFVPCFLLFVFLFFLFLFFSLHPGMFIFFVSLRLCSSHLLLSASTSKYVFYNARSFCLCHLYPNPSRNSLVFLFVQHFFSQLLLLGWNFFCSALVPGTLALDLPTLILVWFFSHCDHIICISLG